MNIGKESKAFIAEPLKQETGSPAPPDEPEPDEPGTPEPDKPELVPARVEAKTVA